MSVCADLNLGGFSFENCKRNAHLESIGVAAPKIKKTGTTIAGAICKDGIVLGSDTRATSGDVIADRDCLKIHKISSNMFTAGAGGAADLVKTAALIASWVELHRLNTGRTVPVAAAARMAKQLLFRYQGYIQTWFLLGGVDSKGTYLYDISAHGSISSQPFAADGSGSLAALSVLEPGWRPNMDLEECKKLVAESVRCGAMHDGMSGNFVNLCTITKDKYEMFHHYITVATQGEKVGNYEFSSGTTPVIDTKIIPVEIEDVMIKKSEDVTMASP